MPIQYAQGDIFQVGQNEGYDFILVFGHIGLNEMAVTWRNFKHQHGHPFKKIDDPFGYECLPGPVEHSREKWIQFVPEEENNGIGSAQLQKIIDIAFDWAFRKGLRSIITNGVRNTDHGMISAENRASDDRRVRFLDNLVRKHEHRFRVIKLISLSDSFIRNFGG